MKKLLVILFLFNFLYSYSQTEYGSRTLLGSSEPVMTGFFSVDVGLYGVDDYAIGSMGFTLAATTNKIFSFGAVGNWIMDSPDNYIQSDEIPNGEIKKTIGYGGLLLEPALIPSFPINITLPIVIGYGVVNYHFQNDEYWDRAFQDYDIERQNFFIFSLGVRMQINVTNSIRLAVGPSYKITTNENELQSHDFDLLNGLNLDLSVKLGKY
jgi:hypothetical protein